MEKFLDDCELEPKAKNMDFVLVFLRQFMAVVGTRIKLIEFYGFLSGLLLLENTIYSVHLASNWRTFSEEALNRLAQINESLEQVFKNVIRFPQFSSLCTEVSILLKLFKAQQDLLEVPVSVRRLKPIAKTF